MKIKRKRMLTMKKRQTTKVKNLKKKEIKYKKNPKEQEKI